MSRRMFLISCEIAGQERDEQYGSNLDSWNFIAQKWLVSKYDTNHFLVYRSVRRSEQIPFINRTPKSVFISHLQL